MSTTFDRRSFMGYFAGVGLTSTLFPGVLWAKLAAGADITVETIASAEGWPVFTSMLPSASLCSMD